jgi:DNA-binding protein YbaB
LLEDLIITAVAEAQRSSVARMQVAMGALTGGLKLPF